MGADAVAAGGGTASGRGAAERKCQTNKPAFTPRESRATTSHGDRATGGETAEEVFMAL
jgi:hypothetical protein